ncbi:Metallo-dependent phosphatase [Exidia glandulosa HHB12029]|uniref:Metallo-dependent phosphatase n=1 Tax=Exidia glandulosa HHB12029 TaxID=1314781 RepID=A0A165F9Q0_EXIGL|nr:Metallo-dependent phosphatase [Exidia glandulosa HHB12029]
MWTSVRLALLVLAAALAINYVEPLPALLNRLWVHAQAIELPDILAATGPPRAESSASLNPTITSTVSSSPAPVAQSDAPQHVFTSSSKRASFRRRLVAVGDLHGDFPNAQRVLKMAKVIDDRGVWSGETDVFVQTGDIVDRGPDTLILYEMMEKLRGQALQAGGQVTSTLGNHEVMNAIGDWRYVSQQEIQTFGGVASRQAMLAKGWVGRAWKQNYTVAARVPLHPSAGIVNADYEPSSTASALSHAALAVCHGGFAPTYPELAPFPSRINELGATLLARLQDQRPQPRPHPPAPYPGLPQGTTPQEQRLYGEDGPLWYRGWAHNPDDFVCRTVDEVLHRLGTRRMIMGHTPDFEKIVSRCGGKIVIIDTGISRAYGGAISALEIVYTLEPVEGEEEDAWTEREILTALYESGPVLLADDTRVIRGDFSA